MAYIDKIQVGSTTYDIQDSNLKSAMSSDDTLVNELHSLVNYGYSTSFEQNEDPSGSWSKITGIKRNGQVITLNKSTVISNAAIYIRLSGDIVFTSSTSGIDSWSSGVTLVSGHEYLLSAKLLSGTSKTESGSTDTKSLPRFVVFQTGSHSAVGTETREAESGLALCQFTAAENAQYNIAIILNKNYWYFDNAVVLVTLEDLTASAMEKMDKRITALEKSGLPPDYYFANDYLPNKITTICENALNVKIEGERFCFITDTHVQGNARNSGKLLSYICEKTGIRKVVFGGDSEQSESTPLAGYKAILDMVEDFSPVATLADVYYITGNHEMNDPNNSDASIRISSAVIGRLFFDQMHSIFPIGGSENSFYTDDDAAKLRTYFIGCNATAQITVNTRERVINSLFTVPEGYKVLLISHVGLAWDSSTSSEAIQWRAGNIIDACIAMNDGVSCTIYMGTGSTLPHTYDFTGKQREFIGMISGHTHRDACVVAGNRFPIISTACDAYLYASKDVPPNPPMAPGTIYEQCFDVVQIDMENKLFYMTRIGSGSDRVIRYGTDAGLVS